MLVEDNSKRYKPIIDYFLEHYSNEIEFTASKKNCDLICKYSSECKFDKTKQASFSGALGNLDTEVMVIAESPTTKLGVGAFLAGETKTILEETNSYLPNLIKFIEREDNFNTIPYFTDWIKCGVDKGGSKKILNTRRRNCVDHFLLKEIELVAPKIIICVGAACYIDLKKRQDNNQFPKQITLYQITHFSKRASLTLSIEDKENLIWKLELQLLNKKKLYEESYILEYLRKKIEKLIS